jgi:hypothetical protein
MVELGKKHECPDCNVRFYDLGRPQAVCPRCGRDLKDDDREDGDPIPVARVVAPVPIAAVVSEDKPDDEVEVFEPDAEVEVDEELEELEDLDDEEEEEEED